MARKYEIELPYHIPSMFIDSAVTKLADHHEWKDIPQPLREKILEAEKGWSGVDLTQEDLDSIPTAVWSLIAAELGVQWS
jgi:hypothetical protein